MRMEFFRREFAITVGIKFQQGLRRGLELLCREGSIFVRIKRRDDGRLRTTAGKSRWFRTIATLGRRWHELVAGDLFVAVLIECGKGVGCPADLAGGEHAVAIGIEDRKDRRWWRWRAMVVGRLRLLRGGKAGQQGHGELD